MANSDPYTSRFAKTLLVFVVALMVVVSAAVAVPPADRGKPDRGKQARSAQAPEGEQKVNPARKCKAERALGVEAFNERYGTNANKRNAFGKCVSKYAKEQAKKK
ncbi:MAG: hypothetical protein ACRDPZ_13805 [Gaiellaceae bacterium]